MPGVSLQARDDLHNSSERSIVVQPLVISIYLKGADANAKVVQWCVQPDYLPGCRCCCDVFCF